MIEVFSGCPAYGEEAVCRARVEMLFRLRISSFYDQRRASIQASGLFACVVVLRSRLSVADSAQTIRSDSTAYQILTHSVRAAFTEREVVFRCRFFAGV